MKGLMLKDLYILKTYTKNALIVMVVMLCFLAFQNVGVVVVPSFFIFMSMNYLLGLFSYDDTCDWDLYQRALPVSARQIVLSRHLFCYGTLAVVAVLGTMLATVVGRITGRASMPLPEQLAATFVVFLLGLLCLAITLPLCYRFGVEKARYGIFLGYVVLAGGVVGLVLLFGKDFAGLTGTTVLVALVVAGALALALLVGACAVSIRTYKRREP